MSSAGGPGPTKPEQASVSPSRMMAMPSAGETTLFLTMLLPGVALGPELPLSVDRSSTVLDHLPPFGGFRLHELGEVLGRVAHVLGPRVLEHLLEFRRLHG